MNLIMKLKNHLEVVNNTGFINSITEGIKLYNKSIDFLNENIRSMLLCS